MNGENDGVEIQLEIDLKIEPWVPFSTEHKSV